MVQPLAVLLEKTPHRGVGSQGLEELDERPPDRDHRLLDTLLLDYLPIQRLDPVPVPIAVDR
jgi:hypothetical protein